MNHPIRTASFELKSETLTWRKLSNIPQQAYGAAGTREAQVAQASGSLIASRHISQIAELEGKVRKLTVCLLNFSKGHRWIQDKTPLHTPSITHSTTTFICFVNMQAENKKLQKRSKSTQGSPLDSAQMRELRQVSGANVVTRS